MHRCFQFCFDARWDLNIRNKLLEILINVCKYECYVSVCVYVCKWLRMSARPSVRLWVKYVNVSGEDRIVNTIVIILIQFSLHVRQLL